MPRNPVVNRRNVDSPFVRRTMQATGGALDAVAAIARTLSVSKASIVDTAIRHLAGLEQGDIVDLLRHHGHLTDDEYAFVAGRLNVEPTSGGASNPAAKRGRTLGRAR